MSHQSHKKAQKHEADIGASIRQLRRIRELTLEQISRLTGLDVATLSRIETGKRRLTLANYMIISKALKIDPKEILRHGTLPKCKTGS